jgi:hypothetical protein
VLPHIGSHDEFFNRCVKPCIQVHLRQEKHPGERSHRRTTQAARSAEVLEGEEVECRAITNASGSLKPTVGACYTRRINMEQDVNEAYGLELVRRVITEGDQQARAELEQRWNEILLGWLRSHPSRAVACRWQSEEHYIAMAFERFWQAAGQGQVAYQALALPACEFTWDHPGDAADQSASRILLETCTWRARKARRG